MVVLGPLAGKLTDVQENDSIAWLPGDAESTKVIERQGEFVDPNTIPTVVVYERESGITDDDLAKAAADAEAFGSEEFVDGEVIGPQLSPDKQAIQTTIPLNLGSDGWEKAADVVNDWRDEAGSVEGLDVHITGQGGMAADSGEAFKGLDSTLLLAAGSVVIVILLLTYRSPFLWVLPVLSAGVALFSAQGVIYLLAKYADLTVDAQSQGILTVLVFGAGTDYALLLVARYREELRRHHDRHEAMAVALHRAGPAIFASSATVIVGMLCLLAATTNSTQGLGPVAAIGIGVGLLSMLSLLPALLVICGRWVFLPLRPHEGSAEPTADGFWARTGRAISHRPRTVWIATTLVLAAGAIGIVRLDATGLETEEQYTETVDSVIGDRVISEHDFPGSAGNPVQIVASADSADAVVDAVEDTEGMGEVMPPAVQGDTAFIQASLDTSAAYSQGAYDTIDRVRDSVHAVDGADALVGGATAINLDLQRAAATDRDIIIPLVLVAVLLILVVLLRSLLAPVLLVATVVLSFGTALGVSALVFEYVFGFAGADTSLPLYVFIFLVALGIDYNIFLMTRVREESLRVGTRRGSLIGLAATGGVITSAGLVLAGTFATMATLPLVMFAEIGFAVAFGVLLDTIIVRSILVTALNLDLGRHMWWPSKLAKKEDVDPEAVPEESVLVQ
ncbi:MAG: MMPL family transporter [Nocardioidaceae bacterium]